MNSANVLYSPLASVPQVPGSAKPTRRPYELKRKQRGRIPPQAAPSARPNGTAADRSRDQDVRVVTLFVVRESAP